MTKREENLVDVGSLDEFIGTLDPSLTLRKMEATVSKCQHLLSLIDATVPRIQERRQLRQLIVDAQPRQSKWVRLCFVINLILGTA